MLHEFLGSNRDELISRCRAKAVKRKAPRATERELQHGIPVFLEQLTAILHDEHSGSADGVLSKTSGGGSPAAIGETAASYGSELSVRGFTVDQVVHGYGDLCQAITELAIERDAPIENREFRTLNRCLDNAIADAVTEFTRQRDRVHSEASDRTTAERLGFLAHEFRDLLNSAMLAVDVLKSGGIGIGGSTGAVLDRSLKGMRNVCSRALVDVRLRSGIPPRRERILVWKFVEEIQVAAAIDATARGLELVVPDVDRSLAIEVDRQIVGGAVSNLLHNAFKFTRSGGRVSLRTSSALNRVLIKVEDECGGLPAGETEDMFRLFHQRSEDRSGLGLGLSISRRSVEANGGQLHVSNLPGKGCVFTIDLPQAAQTW